MIFLNLFYFFISSDENRNLLSAYYTSILKNVVWQLKRFLIVIIISHLKKLASFNYLLSQWFNYLIWLNFKQWNQTYIFSSWNVNWLRVDELREKLFENNSLFVTLIVKCLHKILLNEPPVKWIQNLGHRRMS